MRYDGQTGAFIDAFVAPGSGGLTGTAGLVFGPDSNLYAVNFDDNSVLRYDGQSGAFINEFVPSDSGGLYRPRDLVFGPDDNLYVSSTLSATVFSNSILRYDGQTGVFIDAFVPSGSGGLYDPRSLVFGPDGNLYVNSAATDSVLLYEGQTGTFLGAFVPSGSGRLDDPQYLIALSSRTPEPVPEPSTLLLFGSGLSAWTMWQRRKKTSVLLQQGVSEYPLSLQAAPNAPFH